MRFRLVPSNDEFYALFADSARNMVEAVACLTDLVENFTDLPGAHRKVKDCERRGDELTRGILRRLDATFVTPFDREDIHALAENLDDVVDDIYHLTEVLVLVPIQAMLPELAEQVKVMTEMADLTVSIMEGLEAIKGLRPLLEQVSDLESRGDEIYRRTLGRLFSGEFDALEVLKWKDITQAAEDAIDALEDVADVVASIAVKHA